MLILFGDKIRSQTKPFIYLYQLVAAKDPVHVRLYGIDAPESKQAFGQKAKQAMIQLVANQVVSIQDHGQDVYGRMLGTIYLNNNDVNAIMVANGMAWAYRYQGRLIVPEYGPLEQNARNEGKGLWSDPHAIEPRQWRKANN